MSTILNSLIWSPSKDIFYVEIAGAFQLVEDFFFQLEIAPDREVDSLWFKMDKKGRVTVKTGYVWDGASGLTFDTPSSIKGSCGHDIGYKAIRLGYLDVVTAKPLIDRWFYEQLLRDGMLQYRAYAWWRAVQEFGNRSCLPDSEAKIKRAPIPFPAPAPETYSPIPGITLVR
jgi:hypothetical protein